MLNSILNDILLVVLNLIVDLVLLRQFHRHLDRKARHIIDMDQRKNIQKSKKKLNRMIFFNGLIYVFAHVPEFVTTLLLVVYARRVAQFCEFNFSCDLVSEEAECFSLISIVCQFYIFKVFDKNFKASFCDLRERFFLAVTCKKTQVVVASRATPTNVSELRNLANLIGNGLID